MTAAQDDAAATGGRAVRPQGAAALVGGAIVFLSMSDTVFVFRAAGMTFRWAQFALLLVAIHWAWSMRRAGLAAMAGLSPAAAGCALALGASFGVTAALSAEPLPTALRAAWFLANFGICAASVAWAERRGVLARSLFLGVAGVAGVVWIDAVAIHCFGLEPVLGGAQQSYLFEGVPTLRPQAFHYEPSYAACALALASAATLCPGAAGRRASVLVTGLVLSAVVLTSSRAGILAIVIAALTATALLAFARGGGRHLATVGLSWAAAALFLCVFAAAPGGNWYLRAIAGPFGVARTVERVSQIADDGSGRSLTERIDSLPPEASVDPEEARRRDIGRSEIGRLSSYLRGLDRWRAAPWFGHGAARERVVVRERLLAQSEMSAWVGLLAEFGAFGSALYVALFGAVAWARRPAADSGGRAPARILAAVLLAHSAVSFQLGPSFVRLDYCLLTLGVLAAYGAAGGSAQVTRPSTDV